MRGACVVRACGGRRRGGASAHAYGDARGVRDHGTITTDLHTHLPLARHPDANRTRPCVKTGGKRRRLDLVVRVKLAAQARGERLLARGVKGSRAELPRG